MSLSDGRAGPAGPAAMPCGRKGRCYGGRFSTCFAQFRLGPPILRAGDRVRNPFNQQGLRGVSPARQCGRFGELQVELLNVTGLMKSYGGRKVVDDISFSVNEAEIVGLLGKNGAGKTTSFKMTTGMIPADGGRVIFEGEDVTGLPMFQRARRGMGYLAQEPSVFQRLSVEENLLAILEMMHLSRTERQAIVAELLRDFGLTHLARQHARTLSGGERRRLEIARALVARPSLMLLDEPFTGVDPIAIFDIQGFIKNLKNRGIGVLLTDHNVHATLSIVDRAYIVNEGKVFRHGTSQELINDPDVKRVYLGATFRGDEFDDAEAQA